MENQELYIYLDLNGTLDHNFFQKGNIYFKMININTDNPLIQIGNYVFQGSHEDFLGTKVFFMEDKNHDQNDNVFIKETPIHLKYLAKTAKVMQLKWRKISTNIVHVDKNECSDLHFIENYNTVLEKFEKGALNIDDIIFDSTKEQVMKTLEKPTEMKMDIPTLEPEEKLNNKTTEVAEFVKNTEKNITENVDLNKYKLLKDLAKMPVKSKEIQKVYEIKNEDLAIAKDADNFSVLKQLFIQNITFKNDIIEVKDLEFNKYVDVQKSINDGIIPYADNDELSHEQKVLLLNGNNFDNFTLPMKLAYLTEQLEEYKQSLKVKSVEELQAVDEHGRTFKDKYWLLKRVTKELWYYVYLNCSDCLNYNFL